jgi:hypothetical protein
LERRTFFIYKGGDFVNHFGDIPVGDSWEIDATIAIVGAFFLPTAIAT